MLWFILTATVVSGSTTGEARTRLGPGEGGSWAPPVSSPSDQADPSATFDPAFTLAKVSADDPAFFWEDPRGAGDRWSIGAGFLVRAVRGNTLVRENSIQGTRINLHRDLGMDVQEGGQFEARYEGQSLVGLLDVEYFEGSGRNAGDRDLSFNGYQFVAGDPLHTLTHFLTVRVHVELKGLFGSTDPAWTGPVVGLEFPYYYMNVTSAANPHNSEDWTHNYPYPVIGWGGRVSLLQGLTLEGRATIGYFPNLPSAFTEGGRLYVSSRASVWVDLRAVWELSRSVRLALGFQYQYWNGGDHSTEDGNKLRFSSPGALLGLDVSW